MFKPCCTVAAVCVSLSGAAVADILHVPGDYRTIQEAIDAAMDGDEVEVHPGTYNETINLIGKKITVRSSDGPEVTTIDAQGNGSVVTCDSGEGPDTILEGFTITGGLFEGGGMRNIGSSPTVRNCTFSGNMTGFLGLGGGMYNDNSSPTVTNCTFSGNTASGGGGMYNSDSSPTVTNCTFSGNAAIFGGGMANSNSSPTVTNCIFWDDSPTEIVDAEGSISTVRYTDIQGGWTGAGSNNIDADPMFVDGFHLSVGSPCVDAADNNAVPKGIETDLDGNPRFIEDPNTPDTGSGVCPIVDMGAYEFQEGTPGCCPWDLDGNSSVGILDLLALLAAWGTNPGGPPDFDGDGTVGILDLLTLLANWGPCS